MIVLFFLAVTLLSFTRVPMWLQVMLMLAPSLALSVSTHEAGPVEVTVLALIGALVIYAPVVFLASFVITGGAWVAFRRLRFLYFVFTLILFVVVVMNMTQLIGIF